MVAVLLLCLPLLVASRPNVLDVPLQSTGAGTICGDLTCSYCCLQGFVCAKFLADCAYISTDRSTEEWIFIIFGAFLCSCACIWLFTNIHGFLRNRDKRGQKQ